MQLRTIHSGEREAVLDLLGAWEGESRAHFARYIEHDPTYRDDLCFVAADGDQLVSTLQVFRKRVRLGGTVLDVAGVGNVFTASSHRQRGIANDLLRMAVATMRRHSFDLSLLFATRLEFYSRLGWTAHPRQWAFVDAAETPGDAGYELSRFTLADLAEVRALYDAYCDSRNGTTVRDAAYWAGQLHTAGQLDEDFWIARADGEAVAYARGTRLYGIYILIEHTYRPGHEEALCELVRRFLAEHAPGQPGITTQFGSAPEVLARLEAAGHRHAIIDDSFWMWRVIDAAATARKLGCTVAEVARPDFFLSVLPPDASVYWLADRF